LVFLFLFAQILASCDRIQIVTTRRLMSLSRGVFGEMYKSDLDINKITCAAVLQYHEFRAMNTVRFRVTPIVGRRLPPLPFARFVGVKDVMGLIVALKVHGPPLMVQHWAGFSESIRQEYRLYLWGCLLVVGALILSFYYETFPLLFSVWIFFVALSFLALAVQRYNRVHTTTWHVVRNQKPWSLWRLPIWRVRRRV